MRRRLAVSTGAAAVTLLVLVGAVALLSSDKSSKPPPDLFAEVSKEIGVDYVQFRPYGCFDPPPCGPLYMSGGAAAADYDGDGFVDLLVTRVGEGPILYRNQGGERFEDVTGGSGLDIPAARNSNGAAFVDVDEDGCLDIVMTVVYDRRNLLFMGDCRGRFDEQGVERGLGEPRSDPSVYGYGIAAGDYDRDGYVDLYLGEWRFDLTFPHAPADSRLLRNRGARAPGHFEDVSEKAGVTPQKIGGLLTGRSGGHLPSSTSMATGSRTCCWSATSNRRASTGTTETAPSPTAPLHPGWGPKRTGWASPWATTTATG